MNPGTHHSQKQDANSASLVWFLEVTHTIRSCSYVLSTSFYVTGLCSFSDLFNGICFCLIRFFCFWLRFWCFCWWRVFCRWSSLQTKETYSGHPSTKKLFKYKYHKKNEPKKSVNPEKKKDTDGQRWTKPFYQLVECMDCTWWHIHMLPKKMKAALVENISTSTVG